jgi:Tfp pilus assembly protein PilN
MIRINLVPPEIAEKRRDEQRWKWVWLGAGIVVFALVLFYSVMSFSVIGKQAEVASIKQQADSLRAQTTRFQIFQQKQADLSTRASALASASQGRVDWARLLNELGLVVPTDIYLTAFNGSEPPAGQSGGTVSMSGVAVAGDTAGKGYKEVAKTLVRLADLQQLDSIWLNNAATAVNASAASTATVAPTVSFDLTAKISSHGTLPPVTVTASGQ